MALSQAQRSIVVCADLPTERDELLARALGETAIDARSTPLPLPHEEHRPETAKLICTVFLPCPLAQTFATWRAEVAVLRALLPDVLLVAIRLPDDESRIWRGDVLAHMDAVLHSFEECVAFSPRVNSGIK